MNRNAFMTSMACLFVVRLAAAQDPAKPAGPVLLMPVFSIEAVEVNSVPITGGPVPKITVAPGDVITAQIFIRNWSPQGQKMRAYQAKIDPAGYTSGTSGKERSAINASTPAPRLKITRRLGKAASSPGRGFHTAA